MIELKKFISKTFLMFRFATLLTDISLFAFGQYFYRFSRVSALSWSGGSFMPVQNGHIFYIKKQVIP